MMDQYQARQYNPDGVSYKLGSPPFAALSASIQVAGGSSKRCRSMAVPAQTQAMRCVVNKMTPKQLKSDTMALFVPLLMRHSPVIRKKCRKRSNRNSRTKRMAGQSSKRSETTHTLGTSDNKSTQNSHLKYREKTLASPLSYVPGLSGNGQAVTLQTAMSQTVKRSSNRSAIFVCEGTAMSWNATSNGATNATVNKAYHTTLSHKMRNGEALGSSGRDREALANNRLILWRYDERSGFSCMAEYLLLSGTGAHWGSMAMPTW
mmetsp:Transcript_46633/g.134298  ORF Transcript_46633/g.134298 Transcript_46633/m.134298 type:complete len:262 (+) Transcript_46633:1313-2098(+)